MSPMLAWIPGLPLAAFAVLILVGRRLGRASAWVSVAALASSAFLTLQLTPHVLDGQRLAVSWRWLSATDPAWFLGLAVDRLSWVMLVLVTVIGTLITIYSIGYMQDDARFSRFFAYLSLFCAAMLGLVMANHFVLLYACWELVGLCSYLLISFWFEKPEAARAGRKAFLTTRVGDTGLLIGILALWVTAGQLHLGRLEEIRTFFVLRDQTWWLTIISTLIFLGAVGKSAQIPLHVWLPDAMEGPTPVSALIHAATMVAAGVYLVARTLPLFTPESLRLVLWIGLATHLFAGTVALTMTDIKRVLAYSTISQLGLMMTALGLGAASSAMFHLSTHAFFKALLFMAAGSVIHATHRQDLRELGGLGRHLPWTRALFLIAALSMGGFPLLSGFWSKDAILLSAREHAPWLMWTLLGGAAVTAGYIFRLYLRCFHGSPVASGCGTPHDSPAVMILPMAALGLGAAFAGFAGPGVFHVHGGLDVPMLISSSVALSIGVTLAFAVGLKRRGLVPAVLRPLGTKLYRLAANKYYVDEAYQRWIIGPFLDATAWLSRFDRRIIDGAVDAAGLGGWRIGQWKERFDRVVIDGIVNGIALVTRSIGHVVRRAQTGVIHHYLFWVVAASVMLMLWIRAVSA